MDESNPNPIYKDLEDEMYEKIAKLGIGPQGFGGRTTALKVSINSYPTHIAGLPVAVNIQCHAARHKDVVLQICRVFSLEAKMQTKDLGGKMKKLTTPLLMTN